MKKLITKLKDFKLAGMVNSLEASAPTSLKCGVLNICNIV